ncbi:MAG: VOC family protein, partial [Acidimicrobiia bacterium]
AEDYFVASHGEEPGIDTGFTTSQDGQPLTVATITVDDLEGYMSKVIFAGGEIVVPRFAIPGIGYGCYFTDTSGMIVGLHQPNTEA